MARNSARMGSAGDGAAGSADVAEGADNRGQQIDATRRARSEKGYRMKPGREVEGEFGSTMDSLRE